MSTYSNSASVRFFAISYTHFATASPFLPGRVLPRMMATLSISLYYTPDRTITTLIKHMALGSGGISRLTFDKLLLTTIHNQPLFRHYCKICVCISLTKSLYSVKSGFRQIDKALA